MKTSDKIRSIMSQRASERLDIGEQLYVVVVKWPSGTEGRSRAMSKAEADASADVQRKDFSGMKPPPKVTVEEAV